MPKEVVTGMALGWDLAIAQACRRLRIPFIAAVPCPEQDARWPRQFDKDIYRRLLSKASEVVVINPVYHGGVMQMRNRWMADNSKRALVLWDGSRGGTGNFVEYAARKDMPMKNCWKLWKNEA